MRKELVPFIQTAQNSHSTNPINLPVLPPIFPSVLLIPEPTLLIAEPAEEVTLDKPSDALEVALEAVSLAFEAVSDAACVARSVVEAWRRVLCRTTRCGCGRRSKIRDAVEADILIMLPATDSMAW